MSWPFSSRFSHSISSTYENRIRSLFEMSNMSPTAAVSTPPVPRFCNLKLSRILLKRGSCGRALQPSGQCQGWMGR
uniref:Uncharacterized protein n=1 Tax=Pygocentrus nattereri TaxID=42514 RepID=A0AAR2LH49_PYGNA